MIIHENKEVYIHIPKCGGISVTRSYIAKYFAEQEKAENRYILQHRSWNNLAAEYIRRSKNPSIDNTIFNNIHASYDQIALQYPDYKYYTVIRHPLDRWESLYKYNCDNYFIIDWDIITWTKIAMESLWRGSYIGVVQDVPEFEKAHVRVGSYDVMYKPAWTYYREPEVEVHRLEDQTIWKRLGLINNNHHKSITQLAPYDRSVVQELIYDYYKKDFERWEQFN